MRLLGKTKLGMADDGSNKHSKESEEEWKVLRFDYFPKETPHYIKTALKEEHKVLLVANDKFI